MYRKNVETGSIYKTGDTPTKEDLPHKEGKVFLTYRPSKGKLPSGFYKEEWKTLEKYKVDKKKLREKLKIKGKKEINPETGKLWIRGDICKERGYFWEYMRLVKDNGWHAMLFQKDFDLYHRERIKTIFMKRRIFATKQDLPFNITWQYLFDIFPKDFICPVLGIKLEWTGLRNGQNNPSLDRKVPEKGYVKNNVFWISYRANQIKNDATIEELQKIIRYVSKDNKEPIT